MKELNQEKKYLPIAGYGQGIKVETDKRLNMIISDLYNILVGDEPVSHVLCIDVLMNVTLKDSEEPGLYIAVSNLVTDEEASSILRHILDSIISMTNQSFGMLEMMKNDIGNYSAQQLYVASAHDSKLDRIYDNCYIDKNANFYAIKQVYWFGDEVTNADLTKRVRYFDGDVHTIDRMSLKSLFANRLEKPEVDITIHSIPISIDFEKGLVTSIAGEVEFNPDHLAKDDGLFEAVGRMLSPTSFIKSSQEVFQLIKKYAQTIGYNESQIELKYSGIEGHAIIDFKEEYIEIDGIKYSPKFADMNKDTPMYNSFIFHVNTLTFIRRAINHIAYGVLVKNRINKMDNFKWLINRKSLQNPVVYHELMNLYHSGFRTFFVEDSTLQIGKSERYTIDCPMDAPTLLVGEAFLMNEYIVNEVILKKEDDIK